MGRETDRAMGTGLVGQAGPIGKWGKVGAIGRRGWELVAAGPMGVVAVHGFNVPCSNII